MPSYWRRHVPALVVLLLLRSASPCLAQPGVLPGGERVTIVRVVSALEIVVAKFDDPQVIRTCHIGGCHIIPGKEDAAKALVNTWVHQPKATYWLATMAPAYAGDQLCRGPLPASAERLDEALENAHYIVAHGITPGVTYPVPKSLWPMAPPIGGQQSPLPIPPSTLRAVLPGSRIAVPPVTLSPTKP